MKVQLITLGASIFIMQNIFAQKPDWQHSDPNNDSVFGISTKRAYNELLSERKSSSIFIAVIDSGIDTLHEDLRSILWINKKEKKNGKDDDRNGYIDDLHGWNFIGGKKGNVNYDNLELTRIFREQRKLYDSISDSVVAAKYFLGYQNFTKVKKSFFYKSQSSQVALENVEQFKGLLKSIVKKIGTDNPSVKDLKNYKATNNDEENVIDVVVREMPNFLDFKDFEINGVEAEYNAYKSMLDYQLNLNYDPRSVVGDNYSNKKERYYGNNDVMGGRNANHGTHVTGIIAAVRNNQKGIDGIADNVQVIFVRAIPEGDERDKDVANAIRYAVDNGARIINMSFGKLYSPDKQVVDDAVKYAMKRDVLLIHAAGNDGQNLDESNNFPNHRYADGADQAIAWIEVGASDKDGKAANFSNYGKVNVDVFAPGVHIYSTLAGNRYGYDDGTSMAAPMVTGLAALIREYYPKLTAVQVKDIIMKSVVKRDVLKDKCVSGGIVNAYEALKLAANYK